MKSDDEKAVAEKPATPQKADEKPVDTPAAEPDKADSELVVADLDPSDDADESVKFGEPAAAAEPQEAVGGATPMIPAQLIPTLKVVVVLAVVGVLGWSALMITKRVGGVKVNSYQTCVRAGNPVRESYPPVCVDQRTGTQYSAFDTKPTGKVD